MSDLVLLASGVSFTKEVSVSRHAVFGKIIDCIIFLVFSEARLVRYCPGRYTAAMRRWGRHPAAYRVLQRAYDDGLRGVAFLRCLSALRRHFADLERDACHWKHAAIFYRAFLELEPHVGALWIQYGHALKEAGDPNLALAAYETATQLNSFDGEAYFQLGNCRKQVGLLQGAQEAYEKSYLLTGCLLSQEERLRLESMGFGRFRLEGTQAGMGYQRASGHGQNASVKYPESFMLDGSNERVTDANVGSLPEKGISLGKKAHQLHPPHLDAFGFALNDVHTSRVMSPEVLRVYRSLKAHLGGN